MKKLISGLFVLISAFVLATAVFAVNKNDNKDWKEILPMMKQMHPNLSEEQLQKMYEQCRNNGDKMMEHMMNYDRMNQQMMKQGHMNKYDVTTLNQLYLSTVGFKTTVLFSYVNFSK